MFPDVTVNNFGDILASLNLAVQTRGKEYLISVFKHKMYHKNICVDSGLYLNTYTHRWLCSRFSEYLIYTKEYQKTVLVILFLLEIHSGFEIRE